MKMAYIENTEKKNKNVVFEQESSLYSYKLYHVVSWQNFAMNIMRNVFPLSPPSFNPLAGYTTCKTVNNYMHVVKYVTNYVRSAQFC